MTETLESRASREQKFHDEIATSLDLESLQVRPSFESPTAIENRYALEEMGDLTGKSVLDLGCGAGETSVYFALRGAKVTACDISAGLLKIAKELSSKYGVKVNWLQSAAENLPWPDASFDFVFCNGVLHHVDLLRTGREVSRVLKKGGKALFIEPLPYNPAINIYRWMARDVRSEDEKPLSFGQIHSLRPFFTNLRHKEFWFFSLLIFFHFFFVRRWHPSKVRYWKKVIEVGEEYRDLFARWQALDHFFLKIFPFLRPLCWNTVIVAEK